MAPPRPWTKAEDRKLARLHKAGKSLHAISKEMGRSKGMIGRHAEALGLAWDRSKTAAAAQAKQIDNRARRAELEQLLLEDAARLRKQMWEPCTYFEWGGRDHTYAEKKVDEPTPADKLKLMQATGIAVERSIRIAEVDAGGAAAQVASVLGQLAGKLLGDTP